MNVNTGDIAVWGVSRKQETGIRNKFYSLLINVFTRSRYTHVAVIDVVGEDVFVYEAALEGVRRRRIVNEEIYILDMASEINVKDREYLESLLGQEYSLIEAALSVFGINFSKSSFWFCSELVHNYLTRKGFVLGEDNTPVGLISSIMINYQKVLRVVKIK